MTESSEQIVDEILVLDCQSGRSAALDVLVGRWQPRLWRYARRLTGDPEAAWEVTQESWLGIVRGIRRLNDPARFRPWVYRIVTNKTNDWIKRKAKHPLPQTDEDLDGSAQDPRQANDTAADLQAILHRLGERSRTVLTLHYLEQFDVAEIARILHVPAGTVKSRLHTARAEFKEQWQAANNAPTCPKGETK